MKTFLRRFISLTLCILFLQCIFIAAFALNNTHDNLAAAGFQGVEKKSYEAIYTPLRIDGYDLPVLAYSGQDGTTAFRLYGKIGKKTGYYPVSLSVSDPDSDTPSFVITVLDMKPVKDSKKTAGTFTPVKCEELPEGFSYLNKKQTAVVLQNIYGQKEYYAYGTFDDPESAEPRFGFYKAGSNGKIQIGSLRYDLSDAPARRKPDDVKKFQLPKEYKKGFSQSVEISASNGFTLMVSTFYPALDYTGIQNEIDTRHSSKTGTFTETVTETIPFETVVKENKSKYVTEPDEIIQTGVNGEKTITYKVVFKDGVETKRTKSGEKTVVKPTKQIVERGTKQPDSVYVFSENANLSVSSDKFSYTEGDTITGNASINITGSKPDGGYTCQLYITDPAGNNVAESTKSFPCSVSVKNTKAGKYRITAIATSKSGEFVRSSLIVTVSPAQSTDIPVPQSNVPDNVTATPEPAPAPIAVITTATVTETEDIPFETEYQTDPEMFADAGEKVTRDGITGKKVYTYEITYTDGVQTRKELISETISVNPVNKIIVKGTKQHVSETKQEVKTSEIAVETSYIDDSSMFTDDPQVVIDQGAKGERTITYSVTYLDGVETGRQETGNVVSKEMQHRVIRRGTKEHVITYGEETLTEVAPYKTIRSEVDDMYDDETVVVRDGVNGEKKVTYKITYTDGQETGRTVIAETVTVEPVDEKVWVGTFHADWQYETISIGLGGMHGTASGELSAAATRHAMAMAKSHSVYHAGSGYLESVGGWDSAGAVASGLVGHVPGLARCEFYGAGCVRAYRLRPDGDYNEGFYGVAYGSGAILE